MGNPLAEQHRNTRHDAVDVILQTAEEWRNKGYTLPDEFLTQLTGRIMNLKERNPDLNGFDYPNKK